MCRNFRPIIENKNTDEGNERKLAQHNTTHHTTLKWTAFYVWAPKKEIHIVCKSIVEINKKTIELKLKK